MEASGLVTRRRHPDNRRVHIVEMTDEGAAMFRRLREVAISFDRTLLTEIDPDELAVFTRVLQRMCANVVGGEAGTADMLPGDTSTARR